MHLNQEKSVKRRRLTAVKLFLSDSTLDEASLFHSTAIKKNCLFYNSPVCLYSFQITPFQQMKCLLYIFFPAAFQLRFDIRIDLFKTILHVTHPNDEFMECLANA